jgi:hypothetical protein
VTVGDGEAVGELDDTVVALADEAAGEFTAEWEDEPEELADELPQPASSTRAPARAQVLERRVIDMFREPSRHRTLKLTETR